MLAEATGRVSERSSSASGSKEVSNISSLVTEDACLLPCEPRGFGLLELLAERGRRFLLVDGAGNSAGSVGDIVRSIMSEFVAIVEIVKAISTRGPCDRYEDVFSFVVGYHYILVYLPISLHFTLS